jgi:N6-L-threonylcarbamoyladenine synthase
MLVLTLESTCDETAAAVICSDRGVLGSMVASQEELHQKFNGVVPEIAARAHLERILPVIHETLNQAQVRLEDLSAIGVATTPGLAGSLLVGLVAAKTLCWLHDIPLVAINHLHAHIYACQLGREASIFPCVGFIVSGGHSHLYKCSDPFTYHYLGGTIDDAAGECFDKVASMLGLPYPGGPALSRLAETGNPKAHRFPRPLLNESRLAFSFSGLKTAVRYFLAGPGQQTVSSAHLSPAERADLAASFQAAVVDCLVGKAIQAIHEADVTRICVGGGVAANSLFRNQLAAACEANGFECLIAAPELCTDNAVMGAVALERLKAGLTESLDLDICPGLVRNP